MKKNLFLCLLMISLLTVPLSEVFGQYWEQDTVVPVDEERAIENEGEEFLREEDRIPDINPDNSVPSESDEEENLPDTEEGMDTEDFSDASSDISLDEFENDAADSVLDAVKTEQEDGMISRDNPEPTDEGDFMILDGSQADRLQAGDEGAEEFIQEIEEGNLIGLVSLDEPPVTEELLVETTDDSLMAAALEPDYYFIKDGSRIYCDEVWTAANDYLGGNSTRMATTYRQITYVDYSGVTRKAPIYFLNASNGALGDKEIEDEAVKALTNTSLQKILYYGYGGPGDICDVYDPSCSHIDWTKWQNRFVFTHEALSKIYSSYVGGATAAELEHVGINRFITKILSMPQPSHNNTKLTMPNKANEVVTGTSLSSYLMLHSHRSASAAYLKDTFQNGYYISRLITVSDSSASSNGIAVTRKSTDTWQLLYWTSADDYTQRGLSNPRTGPDTGTVNLKAGSRLRFVFPASMLTAKTFTFSMLLKPVSFLLVDTSVQTGSTAFQDYGAYAYQGTQGTLRLTLDIQPQGTLLLTKKDSVTSKAVAGAVYGLYAGEDLYSGNVLVYKKDTKVISGTTDSNGQIRFSALIPGKYYVKETASPDYYLKNSTAYSVTVSANVTNSTKKEATVTATDTPVLKGMVSVEKQDESTGELLEHAEFTVYEWSETSAAYGMDGRTLIYNENTKMYECDSLQYSEENKGKFLIRETANPDGYEGEWSQEFTITKNNQTFFWQVTNKPVKPGKGKIIITKRIKAEDIVWAHGYPVFQFVISGTDEKGLSHEYGGSMVFRPETLQVDSEGYAYLSKAFSNVIYGTYQIKELPTLRYYLYDITSASGNVSVIHLNEPAYGLKPEETAVAETVIHEQTPHALVTFTNHKQRNDNYSHTSFLSNRIPIIWENPISESF